jgi:hypothetical protein
MRTRQRRTVRRPGGTWTGSSDHGCDVPAPDEPPANRERWRCEDPDCRAWWRFKADEPAKKRKRVKAVSDKRRDEKPERDRVRAIVWKRDGGKCRLAPFFPDEPCRGELHPHHLKKASAMGPFHEDNMMLACDRHNDLVEEEPDMAEAMGLVDRTQPPIRQRTRPEDL